MQFDINKLKNELKSSHASPRTQQKWRECQDGDLESNYTGYLLNSGENELFVSCQFSPSQCVSISVTMRSEM